MWGGTWECRVYEDGSARVRVNHPSNDPEVEFAMMGRTVALIREKYGDTFKVGPMVWRDDP